MILVVPMVRAPTVVLASAPAKGSTRARIVNSIRATVWTAVLATAKVWKRQCIRIVEFMSHIYVYVYV
jgi:hypothetical protein